jgi:nicotinamidase-related amidase
LNGVLGGSLFMKKTDIIVGDAKAALLVIDVQNYFFERKSRAFLRDSPPLVPRINRLIAAARTSGWPVVYTVHSAPTSGGNLMAARWDHLPAGEESRPFAGVVRRAGESVVKKEHYSAFMGTGLAAMLTENGISSIVLCGVMTHLCVDTTARHGFMLGFRPVVVSDACCSNRPGLHASALACLGHGFADIGTSQALLRSMHV